MNIKQAHQILAAALPDRYCISLELWNHRHPSENPAVWRVWSYTMPHAHFQGTTLAAAVNHAVEAHQPHGKVDAELEGLEEVGKEDAR